VRKALWTLGVLVVLVGLVVAGGFLWLRSCGRPVRTGEVRVPGLQAPVTVRWDRWGVPHVTAEHDIDLARAVGWLHANDRMAQMELGRRAAAGHLSEVFGERTLELDRHFRTLRLDELARRIEMRALGAESRAWLTAYAEGVDAWLEARGDDLPPELRLLGVEPEPWRPSDSLGFAMLLAHDLSFWLDRPEEVRFRWLAAFGPEGVRDLTGFRDLHIAPEIAELARELAAKASGLPGASASTGGDERRLGATLDTGDPGGSNNWAVSGAHTASGLPLFANDPHLPLRIPSTWYQVWLRVPADPEAGEDGGERGYEAAGWTLPGLPGVIIGRNRDVAWGFTYTMLDDHDLFVERLSDDGSEVLRGDTWQPLEMQTEKIRVRDGEAREIHLYATERGPLLPEDPELGLPPRSLAWTLYYSADPVAAFLELGRTRRVEEIPEAVSGFVGPAQNLVAADRHGGLLYTVMGQAPSRRTGDGRLPSPGWNPAYGWDGLRVPRLNPTVWNPPAGVLVTANSDHRPAGYAEPWVLDADLPHRGLRIEELLAARDGWRAEEMGAIQTDVTSLYALRVVEILVREGRRWRARGGDEGDAGRALELLEGWDGAMRGAEGFLFELVERELGEAVFGDEAEAHGLPPLGRRSRILRVLKGGMTLPWFDDVRTDRVESRGETLERAVAAAWRAAVRWGGDNPARWSWREIHHLFLDHPLYEIPGLSGWFGRGPFPVDGSATTPDAHGSRWPADPEAAGGITKTVTYAPSLRWVVDLADPDGGLAVLPGGQSGHPGDRHYDDQMPLYLEGKLRPVPWSEEAVEAATVSRLRLTP